ncbi:MAG TPA: glycogen/starch/alpha-glucan phosphorylase [bacterium]
MRASDDSPFDRYDEPGEDAASLRRGIVNHLVYTVAKDQHTATDRDLFHALVLTVRDRLIERWMETMHRYYERDAKRVYYFSMEFLIGRSLTNSLLNTGLMPACREALAALGLDYERLAGQEEEAALGNGGLGRLAACILDAMATLGLPGYGYGIRYEYGMFYQKIEEGAQVEHLEHWLRYGNPWEFPRAELLFPVRFGGRVVEYRDSAGRQRYDWRAGEQIMAMAYDTPIPGYGTDTVNNMRLWSAKATREFDLRFFNEGDYIRAVQDKIHSENLTRVLYPSDSTEMGRELRFQQEYFFVSASLQDILARYAKMHDHFEELPEHVAVQLNDTHPALAIPELMRLLCDVHGLDWDRAWSITTGVFAYTNHTLLPEALETWPVAFFEELLPRHLQIIYRINQEFLADVRHRHPGDEELVRRVSLIDEAGGRRVRMANLAIVGSHAVNGVSALHADLMRRTLFADFEQLFPGRMTNITNGITPRRWLNEANPRLAGLISARAGSGWVTDLERLRALEPLAGDPELQREFLAVKRANKERLAGLILRHLRIGVDPDSLFDVQIKRIHEYKRQLLNLLGVIARYNRLRADPGADVVPRTVIFAGKAAPSYALAKLIIRLIHAVADVIDNDPAVAGRLKIVFIPNYDVSTACDIIPAAELSQQISTAGFEASGTGNMKLALNGALTLGTLDGATVEICQAVGEENLFVFGLTAAEVLERRRTGHDPWACYSASGELRQALDMIGSGYFAPHTPELFRPVVDALTCGGDPFLVLADFESYCLAQQRVDELYRTPREWARRAILTVARMGRFSIDRTVGEYAARIWGVVAAPPR